MGASEDQISQFAATLGACFDGARLAQLPVEVELDDGTLVEGVVTEPATADTNDEQFDSSGTREYVEIGETLVMTAHVRSYRIIRPS